jgi:hypothetical protein
MVTTKAEKIVSQFVAAFERNDVDELVDNFTDDACGGYSGARWSEEVVQSSW